MVALTHECLYCICSVLLEMQTRLQDFSSFSTGLLADLEMSEQHQNKVNNSLFIVSAKQYNSNTAQTHTLVQVTGGSFCLISFSLID